MGACNPVVLLLIGVLVGQNVCQKVPYSNAGLKIKEEMFSLANTHMGLKHMQDTLDETAFSSPIMINGEEQIQKLSHDVGNVFGKIFQSVTNIKEELERLYPVNAFEDNVKECCKLDETVDGLEYNNEFFTKIANKLCFRLALGSHGTIPASTSLLKVMKRNVDSFPEIKWQYYGTEEGTFVTHPARSDANCDSYDPRFRPWYVEMATPTPKDIVIVFDRSGSMKEDNKLALSRIAAATVIGTLNPNDRVALVYFSSVASTPPGDGNENCYNSEMAFATPDVEKYLIGYLDEITSNGDTDYIAALEKAFSLLNTLGTSIQESRKKALLFLTDGQSSRGSDDGILEKLSALNAVHHNQVTILTFALGQEIYADGTDGTLLLRNMANMTVYDRSAGERQKGHFEHINDTQQLRTKLGSYYNHFTGVEQVTTPIVSVPYTDYSGLGHIFSTCAPVKTSDMLKGVACIDIQLDDIKKMYKFIETESTYVFIIDETGRTLVHPLLPSPGTDAASDPIFVNIKVLEPEAERRNIITEMISQEYGNRTISKDLIISRGNAKFDGVNFKQKQAQFFWKKINGTQFIVCLVIINTDASYEAHLNERKPVVSFNYHKIDSSNDYETVKFCSSNDQNVTKDFPTVQFSKNAYNERINRIEDKNYVTEIRNYFQSLQDSISGSPPEFKSDVRSSIRFIEDNLFSIWKNAFLPYMYKIYIGTYNGIFIVFPGQELPSLYDHTHTNWYKKAKANPSSLVFMTSGRVVKVVKALQKTERSVHSEDDFIWGVLGMDLSWTFVKNLVTNSIEGCSNGEYKCLLMDNNGYLLYHPTINTSGLFPIPLAAVEPDIASILIKESVLIPNDCTDYSWKEQYHTWKIANQIDYSVSSSSLTDNGYFITEIDDTNLYFLYISNKFEYSKTCLSCPTASDGWAFDSLKVCDRYDKCYCPCNSTANYQHCKDEFILSEESTYPPCLRSSDRNMEISEELPNSNLMLEECFPHTCSEQPGEIECSFYSDCYWCSVSEGTMGCHSRPVCFPETTNNPDSGGNLAAILVPIFILALLVGVGAVLAVVMYRKNMKPLTYCIKEPIVKAEGIYTDIPPPGGVTRAEVTPYHISRPVGENNFAYLPSNRPSDASSQQIHSMIENPEVRYIATDSDDARPVIIIPVRTSSRTTSDTASEIPYLSMDNTGRLSENRYLNGEVNSSGYQGQNQFDRNQINGSLQRQNISYNPHPLSDEMSNADDTSYEPIESPTTITRAPEENSFRSSSSQPTSLQLQPDFNTQSRISYDQSPGVENVSYEQPVQHDPQSFSQFNGRSIQPVQQEDDSGSAQNQNLDERNHSNNIRRQREPLPPIPVTTDSLPSPHPSPRKLRDSTYLTTTLPSNYV